jgi:hypothetical protein
LGFEWARLRNTTSLRNLTLLVTAHRPSDRVVFSSPSVPYAHKPIPVLSHHPASEVVHRHHADRNGWADPECMRYAQDRASRSIFLFPWSAITGHFRNHAALGLVDPEARSHTWLTGVLGRETANTQRAPCAGQQRKQKTETERAEQATGRGTSHPRKIVGSIRVARGAE